MIVRGIVLQNFRSYQKAVFEFNSGVNLIIGKNGSGKSNLLEAIFFLASGKSFRSSTLTQMISWQEKYAIVAGKIEESGGNKKLESQLIIGENGGCSRKFLVNGVLKPRFKYLEEMRCVLFDPEDIRLISGSPSRRREFLDIIFTTNEWTYAQALSQYNKALKQRNRLLDLIRIGKAKKSELFYWDQSLLKNSVILQNHRQKFMTAVNEFWTKHQNLEINKLTIKYRPSIIPSTKTDEEIGFEISSGYTRKGPHRDDFWIENQSFENSDKNVAFWGSRGQQRLAVLALRLGQLDYFSKSYGEKPILLLDDIFSELDDSHRQLVVDICDKYQVIFTTAEEETLKYLPTAKIQKI